MCRFVKLIIKIVLSMSLIVPLQVQVIGEG
jgi:hypothetical protein